MLTPWSIGFPPPTGSPMARRGGPHVVACTAPPRFSHEFALRYERSQPELPPGHQPRHQLARRSPRTDQPAGEPIPTRPFGPNRPPIGRFPILRSGCVSLAGRPVGPCSRSSIEAIRGRAPAAQSHSQPLRTPAPPRARVARTSGIERSSD